MTITLDKLKLQGALEENLIKALDMEDGAGYEQLVSFGRFLIEFYDAMNLDYRVCVYTPADNGELALYKEEFQRYLDETGEDTYSNITQVDLK